MLNTKTSGYAEQRGMMLLEALIAILIFSLGILGMVAINARAVQVASDAQYRTDAAKFVSEIAAEIALSVDRTSAATITNSLTPFAHMSSGNNCALSGTASSNAIVTAWLARLSAARTGLPGVIASGTQICVSTGATDYNKVTITLRWQPPSDVPNSPARSHALITYIN
jgi:type IV pilus assembly protein PilV